MSKDTSTFEAMETIKRSPGEGGPAGIALVVDDDLTLRGILTDGDIRQLVLDREDLARPVSCFMRKNPITVEKGLKGADMLLALREKVRAASEAVPPGTRSPSSIGELSKIIIVDGGHLEDVLSPFELLKEQNAVNKQVVIMGLGYVGLTLAAVLADEGFQVAGIEPDESVLDALKQGEAPFFEDGLSPLIRRYLENRLVVRPNLDSPDGDIYIVSVGTPIDINQSPRMDDIRTAAAQIARVLKFNDLVIIRSTVPPQSCRETILPILEKGSGLRAGKDFFFVFAPERTVEGKALQELRDLPQIIGGFSRRCVAVAADFFSTFAPTIVRVDSLESAEMVKLINNAFRDVSFGFANQIALLCEKLGVDTVATIKAANEGYSRNPVPVPSPGVGGSCLKKDPYILLDAGNRLNVDLTLVRNGRKTNEHMIQFIVDKITDFVSRHGLSADCKVFVAGIAFKGAPETSDIRSSTGLDVINRLARDGLTNVAVFDQVVGHDTIAAAELNPAVTLEDGFRHATAVLIMNNHLSFRKLNIFHLLESMSKPGLFFDGWHEFKQGEVESVPGIEYHGLGVARSADHSD